MLDTITFGYRETNREMTVRADRSGGGRERPPVVIVADSPGRRHCQEEGHDLDRAGQDAPVRQHVRPDEKAEDEKGRYP